MKHNLTEIVFILDKSGSMHGLEKDTIGGFNSLIEKQKKESGDTLVTTILFSDDKEIIHDRVPLKQVNNLTEKEYVTSGCTALLDAVGITIQYIDNKQNTMSKDEKPEKTLVIITTDGLENASHEYTYDNVKNIIENKKDVGWEFIFLGANIDAVAEASKFGIDRRNAVDFNCDSVGMGVSYCAMEEAISEFRDFGVLNDSWREEIDKDYKKRSRKNKK